MPLIDFAVALVFLLALVAVARFRKYLSNQDRRSYYHVVGGLTVLAVVSLAQIYNGFGVFKVIPFVSDPLFFKLVFCIGVITGLVLLVNGVSGWAPLSRSYRMYNKERVQRLGLLRRIEQLVRVESRLPVIAEKALNYIVESHGLNRGSVYLISPKSDTPVYVAGIDTSGADPAVLGKLGFKAESMRNFTVSDDWDTRDVLENLPDGLSAPDLVIPVKAERYSVGLFLLWGKNVSGMSDDDRTGLKLAGDIIGHKVYIDLLKVRNDFNTQLTAWRNQLESGLDYRAEIQEGIVTIVKHLRQEMSLHFVSLTMVHRNGVAYRFTIGENDGLLRETLADFDQTATLTGQVYAQAQPKIFDDLAEADVAALDDIVARSELRSLAVLPVKRGRQVGGTITFGSKLPVHFDSQRRAYLNAVLPSLSNLMAEEKHRLDQSCAERRTFMVNNFMAETASMESVQEAFERAAELIARKLNTSVVRISTVDSGGAFLSSRALESRRPLSGVAPARGAMILSLMPYHQLVIETGRPMMINQESTDRKMTRPEAGQIFGMNIKSALLVPVKIGTTTVAIISLAESRTWDRFQFRQVDIQFVSAMAGVLSLVVQLGARTPPRTAAGSQPGEGGEYVDPTARNRIKSSLSGIIGSVELLKAGKKPTGENLERCLSIIDRSVRTIGEYISTGER